MQFIHLNMIKTSLIEVYTIDSNSLEICGKIKIGLLLEASKGSPDLRTGVTEHVFYTAGKIPLSRECLKSKSKE